MVLLHGQPGSAADWQQVADRLPGTLDLVALDRPGYGASQQPAGGFGYGARAVLAELDARGIGRAVLVGHSYGGGVALSVAQLAPERVEALILLAGVGPDCLTGWDRLLAARGRGGVRGHRVVADSLAGPARLAAITRLRGRPITADEHVNWDIWGHAHRDHGPLWRSFLTEQRALVHELDGLTASLAGVAQPTLLIADPDDTLIPVGTTHRLAATLPDARVQLLAGPPSPAAPRGTPDRSGDHRFPGRARRPLASGRGRRPASRGRELAGHPPRAGKDAGDGFR